MDRPTLAIFLQSGPARKFDVRRISMELPKNPATDEAPNYLFMNKFLNNSILFKCVVVDENIQHCGTHLINTIIFMPYDHNKPEDGGESFVFNSEKFYRHVESKHCTQNLNYIAVEHDLEMLKVLDSLPTFSPVIVELAFERQNMQIPEAYLEMSPDLRAKLRAQLKGRIRPLIVAAYQGSTAGIEKAVNDMTSKLFSLHNVREILPLVQALRLPPQNAVETLSSWIGITYFEYEYSMIQDQLRQFAAWLSKYDKITTKMSERDREYADLIVGNIKEKLSSDWKRVYRLSDDYRITYSDLVYNGNITQFSKFLVSCREAYWDLGDLLGRFEQTAIAWRLFKNKFKGKTVPLPALLSFFLLLRKLHCAPPQVIDPEFVETSHEQGGFPNFAPDLF